MVVNAPETPAQTAEVVFILETTAANGAYIGELKANYIIPTLEYFHGGPLEEGSGGGSAYAIVTYKAADSLPDIPVNTYGPFTCPQNVVETIDKLQFIGGQAENRACVAEALVTAMAIFEEVARPDVPMHALLLCCSPPYSAYGGGIVPPGVPATVEQAARVLGERGVQLSIASARRVTALNALYEAAGGDLHEAQQRNYAKMPTPLTANSSLISLTDMHDYGGKDPRHLVLLRGYSLKERPPSPAPPPAPEMQSMDVYGCGRGAVAGVAGGAVGLRGAAGAAGGAAGLGRARGWLAPPRQPPPSMYASNSALITQLAQPSYPPPPPQLNAQQRLPSMVGQAGPSTSAGVSGVGPVGSVGPVGNMGPVGAVGAGPMAGVPQRQYIWSGVLEWIEKGKGPGDQQKVTKMLPCQVSANSKDIEPELKVDTWPSTLLMQLMPKQLISNIGGQYLKDSKSVLFHLQANEALDALTKVMVNGFAGCVHFSSPSQCDIKVLILLYTPDKKAYLGFIPNNQVTFVDRLRKVIQQQKISQIINKQQMPAAGPSGTMGGTMPTATMTGSGAMGGMGMNPAMGAGPSMGGGMPGAMGGAMPLAQGPPSAQPMSQQQVQQHSQGMMVGGKVSRGAQLDGLEAARQHNLERIHSLQQTLEAAHQQEAQYKSQMDIMSHLQAAQQQELKYSQLEEQRKQQQQFQQQQLQQQLRGAVPGGLAPRIMRPMMPSNPGLRHLLQQQPQYRPGGASATRPTNQQQQFDDVSNYDFL